MRPLLVARTNTCVYTGIGIESGITGEQGCQTTKDTKRIRDFRSELHPFVLFVFFEVTIRRHNNLHLRNMAFHGHWANRQENKGEIAMDNTGVSPKISGLFL